MKEMKSSLDNNTDKVNTVNDKIDHVEKFSRKVERDNKKELKKLRKQMEENNKKLKEEFIKSVLEEITPKVSNLQTEIKGDLQRIFQSEIKIQDNKIKNFIREEMTNLTSEDEEAPKDEEST